eukprot:1772464-Prymnesium_polylepis.1
MLAGLVHITFRDQKHFGGRTVTLESTSPEKRTYIGARCEKNAVRVPSSFHGAGRDRPGRAA